MSGKLTGSLYGLDLTDSQFRVASALADHGRDDGSSIFPSIGLVAWKVRRSERQVQRIMRKLEQIGLLVRVADEHQHRAVEYRMDVSAAPARPDYKPEDRKRRVRQVRHPDVAPEENARCDISESRCDISTPRCDIQVSPEPSVETSVEPTTTKAKASPLPPEAEARAKPALSKQEEIAEIFEDYRVKTGLSAAVRLTDQRAKACGGRLVRDHFTVDELKQANRGVARALEDDVLDYPRWTTEFYRVFMDSEHVQAFIDYDVTGDPDVLAEMLACEMPKAKAAS
jgi:hypothetical protein